MSDPLTWIILGGVVLQAGGTIYSASKQAEAANANAQISEDRAKKEREAGKRRETQFRRRGERFMSTQRALFAVSGLRLDEGSALDVMKDTVEVLEMDAWAIRESADATAQYYSSQASLDRRQAGAIMTTGFISAGSSLLTGYSKYQWGETRPLQSKWGE